MDTQLMNSSELHSEHVQWNKTLKSWRNEINSFQDKLGEVVSTNTDKDFLIELAELENNCIIHKEKINRLQDRLKTHDLSFIRQTEGHNDAITTMDVESHNEIKERIETELSLYDELKKDFNSFLNKYVNS